MTPIRTFLGMMLAICAVGCASHPAHGADAATTTPAAASSTIKMSNAVPIEKLEADGGERVIDSKLRLSKGGTIYFGTIETRDDDDKVVTSVPVIARRLHGDYVAVPVVDPRLKNASWQLMAGGPNRGE